MEPAKIDWKRIESKFVEDQMYENINAPKWVDFLAPDQNPVDDQTWFCRPECNHPQTAEDFLRSTPSKLLSWSDYSSEATPFGDHSRRNGKVKRRMPTWATVSPFKFDQDSENHDPNLCTPPDNQLKTMKAAIKSSAKKNSYDDTSQNTAAPSLKTTLSARNLLAGVGGRDILNQITEFCNELKKLATRAREKESGEKLNAGASKGEEGGVKENEKVGPAHSLGELDRRENERKPLLEVVKAEGAVGNSAKAKQQKEQPDDTENVPPPLDLKNIKPKREENLLQIRTNPPSPQCFSTNRATKTTPKTSNKSRLMERNLQEVVQNKEIAKQDSADKGRSIFLVDGRDTRPFDVLWFLKPCTLSGSA